MLSLGNSRHHQAMIIYVDKYTSFDLVSKKGPVCNKTLKTKMFNRRHYVLWVSDIAFTLIVFKSSQESNITCNQINCVYRSTIHNQFVYWCS